MIWFVIPAQPFGCETKIESSSRLSNTRRGCLLSIWGHRYAIQRGSLTASQAITGRASAVFGSDIYTDNFKFQLRSFKVACLDARTKVYRGFGRTDR